MFLKLHIKPDQGTVSCCEHNGELDKENLMLHLNAVSAKSCSLCLKHFTAISDKLHTSLKSASFTSLPSSPISTNAPHGNEFTTTPLISINVIDPDNSNICMCNNAEPLKTITENDNDHSTCSICQNMIEKNAEERRTIVFEKSEKTMFGDVIVNRIDSQYHLSSTYANNPSDIRKLQDPYTPESDGSHSPFPETDDGSSPTSNVDAAEAFLNDEVPEVHNHVDESHNNHSNHVVTPIQLTTRLEILRRESHFAIVEDGTAGGVNDADNDGSKSSKKCYKCCCTIA